VYPPCFLSLSAQAPGMWRIKGAEGSSSSSQEQSKSCSLTRELGREQHP
jgi:hypothetical protein